jgi:hypothetical protein
MKKLVLISVIFFSLISNGYSQRTWENKSEFQNSNSTLMYSIEKGVNSSENTELYITTDKGKTSYKSITHKYTFYRDTTIIKFNGYKCFYDKGVYISKYKTIDVVDTGYFVYYLKNIEFVYLTNKNDIVMCGLYYREGQNRNYKNEFEEYIKRFYMISSDMGKTWSVLFESHNNFYYDHYLVSRVNLDKSQYPYGFGSVDKSYYFYSEKIWYIHIDVVSKQKEDENGKYNRIYSNQFLLRTVDGGKTYNEVKDENGNSIKSSRYYFSNRFYTKNGFTTFTNEHMVFEPISRFLINEETGKCINVPLK